MRAKDRMDDVKSETLVNDQVLKTCIDGLDIALGGGLPAHGLYLIQGLAGSGKTTLACQMGFLHAKQGNKVVVITLLAESHAKMFSHFKHFSFYDDQLVGTGIVFFSGYSALAKDGLRPLLQQIVETVASEKPNMLIIDGFRSVRNSAPSDLALAEFMHSLNSLVSTMRCTTFILSPVEGNVTDSENTLVDGVIELGQHALGMRLIREMQIFKIRGANHLLGKHVFEVKETGIVVYPRFEAVRTYSTGSQEASGEHISTGIPTWDSRIGGGITKGSITCLLGSPGVGKTIMGLHFLKDGLNKQEKCLIVGFYESPSALLLKAKRVGLDLSEAMHDGRLDIMWQLPLEILVDDLVTRVFVNIKNRGVTRVFIDGLEGLSSLAMHPERARSFLVAFTSELRTLGVTTFFSEQLHYFRQAVPMAEPSSSALYENVILLEYFTHKDVNYRQISVMKLRENGYDGTNRLISITDEGITVGDPVAKLKAGRINNDPENFPD
jgi:circadian clock protein KaiC